MILPYRSGSRRQKTNSFRRYSQAPLSAKIVPPDPGMTSMVCAWALIFWWPVCMCTCVYAYMRVCVPMWVSQSDLVHLSSGLIQCLIHFQFLIYNASSPSTLYMVFCTGGTSCIPCSTGTYRYRDSSSRGYLLVHLLNHLRDLLGKDRMALFRCEYGVLNEASLAIRCCLCVCTHQSTLLV
jgi:hypothetical protein